MHWPIFALRERVCGSPLFALTTISISGCDFHFRKLKTKYVCQYQRASHFQGDAHTLRYPLYLLCFKNGMENYARYMEICWLHGFHVVWKKPDRISTSNYFRITSLWVRRIHYSTNMKFEKFRSEKEETAKSIKLMTDKYLKWLLFGMRYDCVPFSVKALICNRLCYLYTNVHNDEI